MATPDQLRQAVTGDKPRQALSIWQQLESPKVQQAMQHVLGKTMTADRMVRLCINAVKKTPDLLKCDTQSVLGAMMASAALGLEPNTVTQQAFLIPYKRRVKVGREWTEIFECQFQVGARGFVTLAYRAPTIKSLEAEAVHEADLFEHMQGSETFLRFRKAMVDRGPVIGAFSHVKLVSGTELMCVLPLDEIHKSRDRSETFKSLRAKAEAEGAEPWVIAKFQETPWVMFEDDMASKTAIKKHAKRLPISDSPQMAAAAELDDRAEAGIIDMGAMVDPDVAKAVAEGAADAPQQQTQQLTDDPSPTLDAGAAFGATQRQAATAQRQQAEDIEVRPVRGAEPDGDGVLPEGKPAAKATRAAAPKAPPAPPPAAGPTLAQYRTRIEKASDAETAALEIDEARSTLSVDEYDALCVVYRQFWGQ